MNRIAEELDAKLKSLDEARAGRLASMVRDAMRAVEHPAIVDRMLGVDTAGLRATSPTTLDRSRASNLSGKLKAIFLKVNPGDTKAARHKRLDPFPEGSKRQDGQCDRTPGTVGSRNLQRCSI